MNTMFVLGLMFLSTVKCLDTVASMISNHIVGNKMETSREENMKRAGLDSYEFLNPIRVHQECDRQIARKCFQNAFSEIHIGERRTGSINCQQYRTYIYCFEHDNNCMTTELAELAADEYLYLQRSPVEMLPGAFLALYEGVKSECGHTKAEICDKYHQSGADLCTMTMSDPSLTIDETLKREALTYSSQIQLGVVRHFDGCTDFGRSLCRWLEYRVPYCSNSLLCLCNNDGIKQSLQICKIDCYALAGYLATTSSTCLSENSGNQKYVRAWWYNTNCGVTRRRNFVIFVTGILIAQWMNRI